MTQKNSKNSECHICMESEMTIYQAQQINTTLKQHIARCKKIELSLDAVNELDTAGVQTLLMAKRAADKEGKGFCITSCSETVTEVFELLNIAHEFAGFVAASKL